MGFLEPAGDCFLSCSIQVSMSADVELEVLTRASKFRISFSVAFSLLGISNLIGVRGARASGANAGILSVILVREDVGDLGRIRQPFEYSNSSTIFESTKDGSGSSSTITKSVSIDPCQISC